MKEFENGLLYNLQFFADVGDENSITEPHNIQKSESNIELQNESVTQNTQTVSKNDEQQQEHQLSPEELIAQYKAEMKKLKAAVDKATSDAAEWKRKYRDTLSEKEKLDMEKAEREAELRADYERLKKESAINKLEKNFLALGYSPDLAAKAAEAQYEGDTDEIFRISQIHQENLKKQLEAEWMKNAPVPPAGNKETEPEDPFLKGLKSTDY